MKPDRALTRFLPQLEWRIIDQADGARPASVALKSVAVIDQEEGVKANVSDAHRFYSGDAVPGPSSGLDRWILGRIHQTIARAPIRLALWDGFETGGNGSLPVATIAFRNRRALFSWLWDSHLNFGETYMFGGIEVRGDLLQLLEEGYRALTTKPRPWWRLQRANTAPAAKANVHHHYDIGNQFYRLWLDEEMVYTCGYFPEPGCTLEQAQIAKMDRVCRKLRLVSGERVVEAGCGWGSLALFMARQYGVHVTAVNISREQIAYARSRASTEGLADRVEFIEDDYRNLRGRYDAFVSVGMLEHVGPAAYPEFGDVIDRSLTDHGRGLLHFIGRNQPAPLNPWIRKRIFPGACTPALREVCEHVLEPQGLSVIDVENLRLHYVKTIEHWRQRFENASAEVEQMFDDTFVRAWRLYLAGSQAAFSTGSMQLFQVVFARGASNDIPWIRV
jgi:cyclopropane-fatty-acyl-phospholipid synthase